MVVQASEEGVGAAHLHPTEGAWWPHLGCGPELRCDFKVAIRHSNTSARLWKCFSDTVGFPMALCASVLLLLMQPTRMETAVSQTPPASCSPNNPSTGLTAFPVLGLAARAMSSGVPAGATRGREPLKT